jgi:transposase, IS5 family
MADLKPRVRFLPQSPEKKFNNLLNIATFPLTMYILLDIIEYMTSSTQHQAWLFYTPLARQVALLKDDLLEPVDPLLDDPELLELVRGCLATRSPASLRTGRTGIAPDRLLRCCVLKHLKGWSFRQLERELRSNLIYRRFTHFDAEATLDHSSFSRLFALLDPSITEKIHERVVGIARQEGVAKGNKLRTDTTCVETNVHFPTDSSLLGDGIRVLSRSLKRIAAQCKSRALEVVNHGRAVKHRLLEISRAAKSQTEASRQRMRDSYHKLLALTGKVMRQAAKVVERWKKGKLRVTGSLLKVEVQANQLRDFLPLVEKVIAQTKERVWGGNRHVVGKVLSLFEPHTQVIRKGKAHKPNEFGRLVRVDEVEHGIVSGYEVLEGNAADTNSWLPAIEQHKATFGEAPERATADRGFYSAKNEREAEDLGVEKVALPATGRLSKKRTERQKERWFKRLLRWRAGCEATISHLKNPFSMRRASYKGEPGFQRYVGWCVITKNLFSIARYKERKKKEKSEGVGNVQGR